MSDPLTRLIVSLVIAWAVVMYWRQLLAVVLILGVVLMFEGLVSVLSILD